MYFSKTLPHKILNLDSGFVLDLAGTSGVNPGKPLQASAMLANTPITDQFFQLVAVPDDEGTFQIVDWWSIIQEDPICLVYQNGTLQGAAYDAGDETSYFNFSYLFTEWFGNCYIHPCNSTEAVLTLPQTLQNYAGVDVSSLGQPTPGQLFNVLPVVQPPVISDAQIQTYNMWREQTLVQNDSMTVAGALNQIINAASAANVSSEVFDISKVWFWRDSYDGESGGAQSAADQVDQAAGKVLDTQDPDWSGADTDLDPSDQFTGQGAR